MFPVLDAAALEDLKVAVHIEPYEGRNHMTVRKDLVYLVKKYGKHPALFKFGARNLPLIYLYDSYRTPARYAQ